jgi:glycosyltransferase involved in cell wall biosynthesis
MRIACDARPLLGPRTGVGVWLEGLLRALAELTSWEFLLALPRPVADIGLGDVACRSTVLAPAVRMPGTLWLTTLAGPSLTGRAEVFLGTLGVLPRRLTLPSVLVVQDVTPRTRPHHHTVANRFCFNAYLEESAASADEVVCPSQATRSALAAILPSAGRRARVIEPGVDGFFTPAPVGERPETTRARFASGRPFIVQLGTLEPRKGIATLLEAHALLARRASSAVDLVLAGRPGWGGDWLTTALARHPEPGRVHLTGYVGREDARALLRHAEVSVVASEEGFGLPLVEAMACGSACVASDAPALREAGGGAALHFPRGDAEKLADAVRAAMAPPARQTLRTAALARASQLRWERIATAWRELLARHRMTGNGASRH